MKKASSARIAPIAYHPEVSHAGFIAGMPDYIYHATQGFISSSGLSLFSRSPAHYKHAPPREPTRNMAIGSATHKAILEPEKFAKEYMILDVADRRSTEYKEAIKIYGADYVLTRAEADGIIAMQESVRSHPVAAELLGQATTYEVSLFTRDPKTGVSVRTRYDALQPGVAIVDLKTTSDARPEKFMRSIYDYRYHVQAALYLDAYQWATGEALSDFYIVAVESALPHACIVYRLDDIALKIGRDTYRRELEYFAECAAVNNWPGYPESEGLQLITLPEWAIMRHEDETETESVEV